MTQTNTEIVRFTMRLDSYIYEQLVELAKKNRRSLNQEITFRLEESLKEN